MKLQEWCSNYPLEYKILLTNNRKNVERLKRRTNKEDNGNYQIINLESLRIEELAKRLYIGYRATKNISDASLKIESVGNEYCKKHIYNLIKKDIKENSAKNRKYSFIPEESICMETMGEILRVINVIRSGKIIVDLNQGSEKEKQLAELINGFESKLIELDQFDEIRFIKEISNDEEAKAFVAQEMKKYKVAVFSYMEDKLTYIEKKFFDLLGVQIDSIDIEADECKDHSNVKNAVFVKSYGQTNEVSRIVSEIEKNKDIPLGEVNIIYSSDEYENMLRAILSERKIPYAFETEYSLLDKCCINLLLNILDWAEDDFSYAKYKYIIDNPLIRQGWDYNFGVKAGIGWGLDRYEMFLENMNEENRQQYDQYINLLIKHQKIKDKRTEEEKNAGVMIKPCSKEYLDFMRRIVDVFKNTDTSFYLGELYGKILGIISSAVAMVKMEKPYYTRLKNLYNYFADFEIVSDLSEALRIIRDRVSQITISDEASTAKVSVMKMGGVNLLERKYQFVIGMSHESFEPEIVDSPVLGDNRLTELVDDKVGYVEKKAEKGKEKEKDLISSLDTIDGGCLFVIAATYNTREFRNIMVSSAFVDIAVNYGISSFEECGYPNVKTFDSVYVIDKDKIFEKSVVEVKTQDCDDEKEEDYDPENDNMMADDEQNYNNVEASADNKEDGAKKRRGFIEEEMINGYRFVKLLEASATALQAFVNCPWSYDYYIKYFMEPSLEADPIVWLPATERGIFFHQVFQEYCDKMLINVDALGKQCDRKVFDDIFDNAVKEFETIVPVSSEYSNEYEKDRIKKQAFAYLSELYTELSKDGFKVYACEKEFLTKDKYIYKDPDTGEFVETYDPLEIKSDGIHISFHGYIDRIDVKTDDNGETKYRISDYKSGKYDSLMKKINGDKYHNQTQIQHYIYADALKELKNTETVDFTYDFPCDGNQKIYFIDDASSPIMMAQDTVPSEQVTINLLYEKLFKALIDDEYEVDEEKACTYCDYKDICVHRMNFM